MCNVELFEEAGLVNEDGTIQYPKTFQELAETGKKIKDATGSAGFVLLAGEDLGADGWHFSKIAWNFGAKLISDNGDGTYTPNLKSPEVLAAMEYVKSLKWTYDILTPDPFVENWGTGFTQIGTGAAAMYIGANDAVEQPTANNGLAVDKLSLVPIPAGPNGDQYSLSGGTPYMFAANATDAEVEAALDFLISFGKAPVVDDATIDSLKAQAATKLERGVPNIKRFPCWVSPEIQAAEEAVLAEYTNVNANLYDGYFAAVSSAGNLHTEDPGDTQAMYRELGKVIQSVLSDENADVQALLDTAQANYVTILNDQGILGE
jgi:ABC-type glycerol-3-phosphate transport system substrate-binding protein